MTRSTRLAASLAINVALVGGQVAAGLVSRSTALIADAGHNLTDVAAVALSLAAVRWALRPRSDERSFGNHRGTILAALVNSAGLAVLTGLIAALAVYRLVHPQTVNGAMVVWVAAIAMVANAGAALALRDDARDLNVRAAMVHMAADVLASLVVLVAGLVVVATGGGAWNRIDPVASLVVAVLVGAGALRITRRSVDVLLESTPRDVDLPSLRSAITGVPGVGDVHDLHVWSLSSEVRALSAHLVLTGQPSLEEAQLMGAAVRDRVVRPFGIAHTTLELESERCTDDDDDPCGMDELRHSAIGSAAEIGGH
jgi:cobalt-zinc-cadmium efflux system protein